MNKKIIIALIALVILAVISAAAFFIEKNLPRRNPAAEVYLNGILVRTLPLSRDDEFTVSSDAGFNTVTVRGGKVSVSSADCPDQVCVHQGAINSGAVPIVCLPHKLEIRVVNGSDQTDAVV